MIRQERPTPEQEQQHLDYMAMRRQDAIELARQQEDDYIGEQARERATEHRRIQAMTVECGNGHLIDNTRELTPIESVKHLLQRVSPGEPMPVGECDCGALAHEVKVG